MQHGQKKRGFLLLASENCQGVLQADSSQLSVPMGKIGRLSGGENHFPLSPASFPGKPISKYWLLCSKRPLFFVPQPQLGTPVEVGSRASYRVSLDLCWKHHSSTLPCFILLPPFPFHWCPFWEHFLLSLLCVHLHLRVWFPRNLRTSPVTLLILKF